MSQGLSLAPLVPWPLIVGLAALAVPLLALAAYRRGRGVGWRAAALAVLVAALLNPRILNEHREARPDVVLAVIDQSASQAEGRRTADSDAALDALRAALARHPDVELREVRVGENAGGEEEDGGSRLFGPLARALADVPSRSFAGAVMITDGQVHDAPAGTASVLAGRPLHVLLSGRKGEIDRRLIVDKAPGYGIVGREVSIEYRVEDRRPGGGATGGEAAPVRFRLDGVAAGEALSPVGGAARFSFVLDHAGPTVVELEAAPAEGELSVRNNRAALVVNGVRDRLRVLLISGQPHAGERTWRNLLKSDPSVDLVHFTILRPPEKTIYTPLNELSLIVFPIEELFEKKLNQFDLVVFDRYVVRDVLPATYFRNIANYLRQGGAILLAVGPEFAGQRSLSRTPLGSVMPAQPTGRVIEEPFVPALTEVGRLHPVTAPLRVKGGPRWGRWFRQIEAAPSAGVTLMQGSGGRPLLVLDRVGEGRIAQLMSDHIWLWARGYDGGGPQSELLRRLAHWLMKEPDLEEEGLRAGIENGRLDIERRSLSAAVPPVTVTTPSGAVETVALEDAGDGIARATAAAPETGLYRVGDGVRTVYAASGPLNPLEMSDLRATARRLAPVAAASGGAVAWIADGFPEIRRTRPGRDTAGRGWIGFPRNGSYVVTGMDQVPLLPPGLVLALALGTLAAAWWREGR